MREQLSKTKQLQFFFDAFSIASSVVRVVMTCSLSITSITVPCSLASASRKAGSNCSVRSTRVPA